MDYSQFRRSENVQQPNEPWDQLWAIANNPFRSQWNDPTSLDNPGGKFPRTAAEFPTMTDPGDPESPLAKQMGIEALMRMMSGG